MATDPDFSKEYPLSDLIQPGDLASYLQFDPREELYNYQGSGLLFDDRYIKMPDGTYGLSQANEAQKYLNPKSYYDDFYAGNRFVPLKRDGTLSNSPKSKNVDSSIIGYADRYPRIPYCRQTAFTEKNFDIYKNALPYIQSISKVFEEALPERWANQKAQWDKTSKDFRIHDTVFTTITVNKNFRTASHYDRGDLKEGFGNLAVLQTGNYEGGYTVIPKYGVAVDVRTCDIALFDVHELHGNTEIKSTQPYERISVICYYREKMIDCGTAEEELNRIKHAR